MASTQPRIDPGRLIALVDYKWRTDRLPFEDIVVPIEDLPDPDADHGAIAGFGGAFMTNGSSVASGGGRFQHHETLKDIERRWNDLALYRIYRGSPAGGSSFLPRTSSSTNATTRSASTSTSAQGTGGASSTAATGSGQ